MKGRMVLAAAPIGKLRVGGRSRRNAGFRRWKRPVSASSHSGLAAPDYDFALGIGDELVSYTVMKPRKTATRYYAHSNHLYSVAAITSSTGSVVERWSYNAYGVPTIKNSANAKIAKSAVGNDRGFTGYKLDSEIGTFYARSRSYSPRLGRFLSRDSISQNKLERFIMCYALRESAIIRFVISRTANTPNSIPKGYPGYPDGLNSYSGNFVPNRVDPSGHIDLPPLPPPLNDLNDLNDLINNLNGNNDEAVKDAVDEYKMELDNFNENPDSINCALVCRAIVAVLKAAGSDDCANLLALNACLNKCGSL